MRPFPALLSVALACAGAAAALPAAHADDRPSAESAPAGRVARVKGSQVNLRSGPSVDHHHLARLERDALVVVVGAEDGEGDWRRVRVPGGIAVYVHGDLVERTEGALRGTVRASDVLMRATPSTAYFALHDQHLQRGDEVLLLEETRSDDEVWVKVVAPPRVHAWVHARYLEDVGPVSEHRDAVGSAALERVDALTGGRTRTEREDRRTEELLAYDAARRRAERAVAAGADVTPAEVRKLFDEAGALAPGDGQRAEIGRMRAEFELQVTRRETADALARARKAEREETERRARLEEKTRVFEERIETLRAPGKPTLGPPDAEGALQRRRDRLFIVTNSTRFVEAGSRRFRLADFVGKRVRVHGRVREGGVLDVEHLEIISSR